MYGRAYEFRKPKKMRRIEIETLLKLNYIYAGQRNFHHDWFPPTDRTTTALTRKPKKMMNTYLVRRGLR